MTISPLCVSPTFFPFYSIFINFCLSINCTKYNQTARGCCLIILINHITSISIYCFTCSRINLFQWKTYESYRSAHRRGAAGNQQLQPGWLIAFAGKGNGYWCWMPMVSEPLPSYEGARLTDSVNQKKPAR